MLQINKNYFFRKARNKETKECLKFNIRNNLEITKITIYKSVVISKAGM